MKAIEVEVLKQNCLWFTSKFKDLFECEQKSFLQARFMAGALVLRLQP